jgi:hypothetical protein
LYIGFAFRKLVGGTDATVLNFNELQLFGKELLIDPSIIPKYISSNVLPNILVPYDTIVQRHNAITSLSNLYISSNVGNNILLNYLPNNSLSKQLYMSSNTVENLYISSNKFYKTSNIVLEKPVKILNTDVDAFNRALIVGDGGRLTINGQYETEGMFGAFSKIGIGDFAATIGGSKNTSITLYENGSIQYYGFASNFSHNFVGKTYMPSLSIANLKMPSNIFLNIGSITADNTGNMIMNSISGLGYS